MKTNPSLGPGYGVGKCKENECTVMVAINQNVQ